MDGMPNFDEAKACLRDTISPDDFYAHMVSHKYIYAPAGRYGRLPPSTPDCQW